MTVLPFPKAPAAPAPDLAENLRLALLDHAAELNARVTELLAIEQHNTEHGARLSPGGPVLDGRARMAAIGVVIDLINIEGQPEECRALYRALKAVLHARQDQREGGR